MQPPSGSLLRACEVPGCGTFTLGRICLAHERTSEQTFVRGRPYVRGLTAELDAAALAAAAGFAETRQPTSALG